MGERWAYSRDGEFYRGDFADWREAALDALHDAAEGASVWVGQCEPPVDPEHYIDADFLIEHIACQDDFNGEWAEDWPGATQAQMDELTDSVRAVIAEWLDRHKLRPRFFTVPCGVQVTEAEALDPACDPFAPRPAAG